MIIWIAVVSWLSYLSPYNPPSAPVSPLTQPTLFLCWHHGDVSEAGSGKSSLDAHFCYIRFHQITQVCAGQGETDIENAQTGAQCLANGGGIANSTAAYITFTRPNRRNANGNDDDNNNDNNDNNDNDDTVERIKGTSLPLHLHPSYIPPLPFPTIHTFYRLVQLYAQNLCVSWRV